MSNNTRYLVLTDYDNRGTVIKQEGRKFYEYKDGEWVRRGLGIGYVSATGHTPAIEYHFCEFVAKDFMEDRRWEEVFVVLYGGFAKYGGKIENRS